MSVYLRKLYAVTIIVQCTMFKLCGIKYMVNHCDNRYNHIIFFKPCYDRQENKRRTKHIPRTLNPEWHQTVMFQDVARLELQNKVLEVTVWDYDRFKTNDFLGELIIELRGWFL